MKIRTSELTGPALDYAVASIEKMPKDVLSVVNGRPVVLRPYWGEATELRCEFSTNWAQGGPIIEREYISTHDTTSATSRWLAICNPAQHHRCAEYGPTPLVAAMRCYVSKCLGHEVDVPEEICN